MTDRAITFYSIQPDHPRRPEPSRVLLHIGLAYLNGAPVASVALTERDLTNIIEQAALGLRVLREQREERR